MPVFFKYTLTWRTFHPSIAEFELSLFSAIRNVLLFQYLGTYGGETVYNGFRAGSAVVKGTFVGVITLLPVSYIPDTRMVCIIE